MKKTDLINTFNKLIKDRVLELSIYPNKELLVGVEEKYLLDNPIPKQGLLSNEIIDPVFLVTKLEKNHITIKGYSLYKKINLESLRLGSLEKIIKCVENLL